MKNKYNIPPTSMEQRFMKQILYSENSQLEIQFNQLSELISVLKKSQAKLVEKTRNNNEYIHELAEALLNTETELLIKQNK